MVTFEGTAEVSVTDAPLSLEDEPQGLNDVRARIIDDILTNGLRSSAKLKSESKPYLSSNDPVHYGEESSEYISFNNIAFTRNKVILDERIKEALYASSTGSLTVVAERDNPRDFLNRGRYYRRINDRQKRIVSKRICSSFLAVCDPDIASRADGLITPDDLSHLIFPTDIWREYLKANPSAKAKFPKCSLVDGFIDREVEVKPYVFRIPDYESALRRILKESQRPIAIHSVRLPIQEDLKRTPVAKSFVASAA